VSALVAGNRPGRWNIEFDADIQRPSRTALIRRDLIATFHDDDAGLVAFWDTSGRNALERRFPLPDVPKGQLLRALSPDATFAIVSGSSQFFLFDVNDLKRPTPIPLNGVTPLALAVSDAGWSAALQWPSEMGRDHQQLRVWNRQGVPVATLRIRRPLRPGPPSTGGNYVSLAFSRSSRLVAVSSPSFGSNVWAFDPQRSTFDHVVHDGRQASDFAFSPSGLTIAARDPWGGVLAWRDGKPGLRLEQENSIGAIAVPDDETVVTVESGFRPNLVRWNLRTPTVRANKTTLIDPHQTREPPVSNQELIRGVRVSPDATRIVLAEGNLFHLWDAVRPAFLFSAEFAAEGGPTFGATASRLMSISPDDELLRIDLDPDSLVRSACQLVGRGLSLEEMARYLEEKIDRSGCGK
jgi:hypothetical protein